MLSVFAAEAGDDRRGIITYLGAAILLFSYSSSTMLHPSGPSRWMKLTRCRRRLHRTAVSQRLYGACGKALRSLLDLERDALTFC